jgi:hypothetical protein
MSTAFAVAAWRLPLLALFLFRRRAIDEFGFALRAVRRLAGCAAVSAAVRHKPGLGIAEVFAD